MKQISYIQYVLLIFMTQVGIGILTLPRDLIEKAGTDGWIAIFPGWIISMGISIIIISIMKKDPSSTIFELLPKYLGKWIGKLFILIWVLYGVISSTVGLFTTFHVINMWILPNTKQYILMLLFSIPLYMIMVQGIKGIARFAELAYFALPWIPVFLLFTLSDLNWLHLLPVIKEGWMPIIKTVKSTVLSFLGFELAFLLYPYLIKKEKAVKGILIANTMSMLVFFVVTIISYLRFSPLEVETYVWPTLNLLKLIRLPFLERFEIIFLSFYLFILFKTIIPYAYLAIEGTSSLFGGKYNQLCLRVIVLGWIVASFFFIPTYDEIIQMGKFWGQVGLYLVFGFPVVFFLYQKIFRIFRRKEPSE